MNFGQGMRIMTANAKIEMSKIKRFIRELSPKDTSPAQLDTYYPLENFEYRGRLVVISRTPNLMRSGCGMKDYTVNIYKVAI